MRRWDLTAQRNALVLEELKHRELYQVDFRSFVMKRGASTSQSNAPSPSENTLQNPSKDPVHVVCAQTVSKPLSPEV